MKKILLLFIMVVFIFFGFNQVIVAQNTSGTLDKIVRKDGTAIDAFITEYPEDSIKYKLPNWSKVYIVPICEIYSYTINNQIKLTNSKPCKEIPAEDPCRNKKIIVTKDNTSFCITTLDSNETEIIYKRPNDFSDYRISLCDVSYIRDENGNRIEVDHSNCTSFRPGLNALGFYIQAGKVIGAASDQDEALDFPVGTGLAGLIRFQHFFKDSNLAAFITTGFMQWKSQTHDSLGNIITNKLQAIPLQIGIKYYKKYWYGSLEAGLHDIRKKGKAENAGSDKPFLLIDNGDYGSKTPFSFALSIGHEIVVNKKHYLDLNLGFQDILYPGQSIKYIGFKAGYNFILVKNK